MNKKHIITHITKELLNFKTSQSKFNPFDIIAKGILVNAITHFYVPQEFKIYHTGGTKVSGVIHIDPMINHNKPYKIEFDVRIDSIKVQLMEDETKCTDIFKKKYDRAMKGI